MQKRHDFGDKYGNMKSFIMRQTHQYKPGSSLKVLKKDIEMRFIHVYTWKKFTRIDGGFLWKPRLYMGPFRSQSLQTFVPIARKSQIWETVWKNCSQSERDTRCGKLLFKTDDEWLLLLSSKSSFRFLPIFLHKSYRLIVAVESAQ